MTDTVAAMASSCVLVSAELPKEMDWFHARKASNTFGLMDTTVMTGDRPFKLVWSSRIQDMGRLL